MIDIKSLKVGQYIRIDGKGQSRLHQGEVKKISADGAEVISDNDGKSMFFDSDGRRIGDAEQSLYPVPDWRTLPVGQQVLLVFCCVHWVSRAKVIEVTPENIVVEEITRTGVGHKIRFDRWGRARDSRDLGYPDSDCCWGSNIPGNIEGGPWYIDGTLDEESIRRWDTNKKSR